MKEIRNLIIGIDFGKEYSQICYYDRKADEPVSLSTKAGEEQVLIPTMLTRKAEQEEYAVGLEAEYYAHEKGGELVDRLYERTGSRESLQVGGRAMEPWELAARYFRGLLRYLGVMNVIQNIRCLTVTCGDLTEIRVDNLKRALEYLGLGESCCLLLDYGEAFYYHAMTQKKELLTRSVAWYDFDEDRVSFRRMAFGGGMRPMLVRLEGAENTVLPSDASVRDEAFCKFAQKTLGKEFYSSIQITGNGFGQDWARMSVKFLCFQKRKVYYGNNLFARGACAAGKEKTEDHRLKGYRFLSDSLVFVDVGMEMRIMGSNAYYPLIESGKNWYECSASCELILDGKEDLTFVVAVLGEPEKKKVSMTLPGLPHRPDRTTRLALSMRFISSEECEVLVKDLGFGEMFPSSGKMWKEIVRWQEAALPDEGKKD